MSYDIDIGTSSLNATYNYQPATEYCGLRSLNDLHGMTGAEVLPIITEVIVKAIANPHETESRIKGNGQWGTYESLLETLFWVRDNCIRFPTEKFEVC